MENNLPQEYKGNFFSNFFKRIKGLFFRKSIQENKTENVVENKPENTNIDISEKLNNISKDIISKMTKLPILITL